MDMKLKQKMEDTLKQTGLPYDDIRVFGSLRCNVHIVCNGVETANKWSMLLSKVFSGAKVSTVKTTRPAKQNKNTCLLPTQIECYLIGVTA